MKTRIRFVSAAVGLGIMLWVPASRAAVYTGTYDWLSQYHAILSASSTAYDGGVGGYTWAPAGPTSTDNSVDRWRQVTWDADVTITRVRTEAWNQIGTIGTWKIQTSPDGIGSWTDFSTHSGQTNVDSTGSVTARALRVLFPAGQYTLNGGNGYGPGIHMLQTEGTYAGGIPETDPQFNILGTTGGFLGTAFSVSMNASSEENPASKLIDGYIDGNGGRVGWYPNQAGNEAITVDLGTKLFIQGAQLWGGTLYSYMPPTANVYTSLDGSAYTLAGAMTGGALMTSAFAPVQGRYVRLTDFSAPGYGGYILLHEVAIFAQTPEPSAALLLGLGGLLLAGGRRRWLKSPRPANQ